MPGFLFCDNFPSLPVSSRGPDALGDRIMAALNRLLVPDQYVARALGLLQPLFALGTRLYVGWVFFRSGWLKISDWEQTIALFEYEYRTPLLSPTAAAILGTFGELAFPVLLWLGLFVVNAMAVISYAHVLLADGFVAALRQHEIWGFMLAMLAIYGPGKLSLDHVLAR
jgi:putative oxidoreductase